MRSVIKFILGVLSHGFILTMIFFIVFLFPKIIQLSQSHSSDLPPEFSIYIPLVLAGAFSVFIPMGLFIGYIFKNPRFSSTSRLVWVVSLIFANAIAPPLFFWAVFVRHPNDEPFFKYNQQSAHA